MIICFCESEPDRNDEYVSKGFSALCMDHNGFEGK
jgi:hypothetical protein